MAELRITKPDSAYVDTYVIANTSTTLDNGVVSAELQIYPRKFPANFSFNAFPFDTTVDELRTKFGSDAKIWSVYDIHWKDTTYGADTNGWNYNAATGEVISQSKSTPPEDPNYTHYVLYIPDENQTTGKIKANTPFLMWTSEAHNATQANPLTFANKELKVPDKVQFYKMEKGMYMYSNMYFYNGDCVSLWGLNDIVQLNLDNDKPYFITMNANTGSINYVNASSMGMQCTGAGFFKVKHDSAWA